MITEFGNLFLSIALSLSLCSTILLFFKDSVDINIRHNICLKFTKFSFLLIFLSFGLLAYAFLVDDFSLRYVANNSNLTLEKVYKFSAVWGAHEGSILLWVLVLSSWATLISIYSTSLPKKFVTDMLSIMALLLTFFLLFILITSNPFDRIFPVPENGRDLNPLLQDPGLIIHPPLLYLGYVGTSVPFAFAVAVLINKSIKIEWISWLRKWVISSWMFLTVGISLGSWWAYHELGWGGWWFWDPVENASLMPWLIATALMHSSSVTEKKGTIVTWTILLSIAAFSLSLLGTFLVRSGVLTSVHAFATDPERGVFLLVMLALFVGGSLFLFAFKGHKLASNQNANGWTRELLLVINNMLLVSMTIIVLIGPLYPLVSDILNLGKISVGPPYFDFFFVPTTVALAIFMGMSASSRWSTSNLSESMKRVILPLVICLISSIFVVFAIEAFSRNYSFSWSALITFIAVLWIFLTLIEDIHLKLRTKMVGVIKNKSFLGMTVAHCGLAILILGVGLSSAYSTQEDLRMKPGSSTYISGYRFNFRELNEIEGPNYSASQGVFDIYVGDNLRGSVAPEKRRYFSGRDVMTEAGIRTNLLKDIYISLGEPINNNEWSVRLYVKPMVRFIWIGGFLIAVGGIIASFNRRKS